MLTQDEVKIVHESYGRCLQDKGWIKNFYDILMKSSPEIPPHFNNTDFDKQISLLSNGISYLIMYANGDSFAEAMVGNQVSSHDRYNLNIPPNLYVFWIESLIKSVKNCDPNFDLSIEQGWRKVVQKGIDDLIKGY